MATIGRRSGRAMLTARLMATSATLCRVPAFARAGHWGSTSEVSSRHKGRSRTVGEMPGSPTRYHDTHIVLYRYPVGATLHPFDRAVTTERAVATKSVVAGDEPCSTTNVNPAVAVFAHQYGIAIVFERDRVDDQARSEPGWCDPSRDGALPKRSIRPFDCVASDHEFVYGSATGAAERASGKKDSVIRADAQNIELCAERPRRLYDASSSEAAVWRAGCSQTS